VIEHTRGQGVKSPPLTSYPYYYRGTFQP